MEQNFIGFLLGFKNSCLPMLHCTHTHTIEKCVNNKKKRSCLKIDEANLCSSEAYVQHSNPIFSLVFISILQFYDLIERNQIAMSNLKLRSLTIFAPTNEAFQKYSGSPVQVQYHMCK